MRKQLQKSLLALVGVLVLSGCDKTKEMFGMKREQPDEFTVLSRPPLSAPPGIGLTPPLPEGMGPLEKAPEAQAKEALLGESHAQSAASAPLSEAEKALLRNSNAHEADSNIRRELAQSDDQSKVDEAPLQDILYWQKKDEAGNVIDAHEEYEKHHTESHPTKS